MPASFFTSLSRTLSTERLAQYAVGVSSEAETYGRYLWNLALCESLYPSLQGLEVALRNALHEAASARYGTPWWFDGGRSPVSVRGYQNHRGRGGVWVHTGDAWKVESAKAQLRQAGKPVQPGRIIAELTFGFWTALFNRHYVNEGLWPALLAPVFPALTTGRTIGVVRPRLEEVRRLRNRVFHHEPVWQDADLQAKHGRILEALGWICPDTARLVRSVDRFDQVYASGAESYEAIVERLASAS